MGVGLVSLGMSFVLMSKNNLRTLCCFAMLGVGQQRKCCFNFGKDKLAQDCSSASGTVRNQRFLLVTPDVLIRNHHLWLPVSFQWQRSSIRCRNSFHPIFTLSHYSILRDSLRKSLRFFTVESESVYTNISRKGKNTACYGSLLRCFLTNLLPN